MVAWPDTWRSPAPTPLHLLTAAHQRGERCALVTVLGIAGGAPRRRGAQLAVTEHGEVAGSLSGGCLDAAVIAEAHAARADGLSRRIRFGADSPYVDVVLPCGSGLDLQFDGALPIHTIDQIAAALTARTLVSLRWESATTPATLSNPEDADVVVPPSMRLLIAGASENLRAMALLAAQANIDVLALTRDQGLRQALAAAGIDAQEPVESQWPVLPIDAWTAALTLFHEHEQEVPFLRAALASPAFVVGAMGSVRAQTQRLDLLRAAGVDPTSLARLRGPFGLLSRTRDPNELAISMLAELWQHWRQFAFNEPE
ncbi:XdhC family protein [Ahniella affigens]|nr:XdhC family protein [Ahniella affigens]